MKSQVVSSRFILRQGTNHNQTQCKEGCFILRGYFCESLSPTKHLATACVRLIKMHNMEVKRQQECFFKQEHIQKGQRLDTTVYCCWTCLEKSEERKIKTDRKRDREKKWDRKRWSVVAYVCGVKTKEAEAAKHVFKLVCQKNSKRDQRLRTHAERGATCCSIVVNLWV